jgi:hypothetical protein
VPGVACLNLLDRETAGWPYPADGKIYETMNKKALTTKAPGHEENRQKISFIALDVFGYWWQ